VAVYVSNLQERITVNDDLIDFLAALVDRLLAGEGRPEGAEAGLVFVDDEYIRQLNLEYRGIDAPTDVLSFAMEEGEPLAGMPGEEAVLGDVVISLPAAQRQAEEYGHSFAREVAYLTVHGVLHLLGYDHATEAGRREMRDKEEAALAGAGLARGDK
jgi:probable rRNA maturation factor